MAASQDLAPTARRPSRRTYLIDREFQLKYTLMLVAAGALISMVFGGMMYLAHVDAQRLMNPPPALQEQLARADAILLALMGAATLMMAAAFGLFGILVTHRVAGPVFVMRHHMLALAAGSYPRLRKLRKKDELKTFFESFQEAIEAMRRREREEAEVIQRAVAALSTAHGPEAHAALEQLRAIHQRKQDAVGQAEPAGLDSPTAEPAGRMTSRQGMH